MIYHEYYYYFCYFIVISILLVLDFMVIIGINILLVIHSFMHYDICYYCIYCYCYAVMGCFIASTQIDAYCRYCDHCDELFCFF